MPRNEAQTRYELIDPALRLRGWNETNIKVEATSGGITIIDGKARRRKGRTDYLLRLEVSKDTQPVAVALIEAKTKVAGRLRPVLHRQSSPRCFHGGGCKRKDGHLVLREGPSDGAHMVL